jgi:hypothetical protein
VRSVCVIYVWFVCASYALCVPFVSAFCVCVLLARRLSVCLFVFACLIACLSVCFCVFCLSVFLFVCALFDYLFCLLLPLACVRALVCEHLCNSTDSR